MLWDAWINEHLWKLHCIWSCTFLLTTCHVEKLTKEIEQWVEILPISPFASPHLQLFLCFHFCLQCFFLLCFQLRLHLCLTKTGPFQVVRITGPSQTFCSGSGVCECVCVCVCVKRVMSFWVVKMSTSTLELASAFASCFAAFRCFSSK